MNLDQLEAVSAVVEKGGFRAAAEFLNKSQPALSQSIKNLEDEFGIKIFDRDSYRVRLTEIGAVFLEASRGTLEAAKYTARVAHELGHTQSETKLRVALDALVATRFIELIAVECSRPLVPVVLILEKTILQASHTQLLEGAVDLALAPLPDDETKIESLPVETVTLIGVTSRKLLLGKQSPDAEFLRTHPQILVSDRSFEGGGGGPKIFSPDHFTKRQLIESGIGWGRLSSSEVKIENGLVPISSKHCKPMTLELCLMRARHRPTGMIARKIWDVFASRVRI